MNIYNNIQLCIWSGTFFYVYFSEDNKTHAATIFHDFSCVRKSEIFSGQSVDFIQLIAGKLLTFPTMLAGIYHFKVLSRVLTFILMCEKHPPLSVYIYIIYIYIHEFKSLTRLIAFHITLIPLGKVWIQLFYLQLLVNRNERTFPDRHGKHREITEKPSKKNQFYHRKTSQQYHCVYHIY